MYRNADLPRRSIALILDSLDWHLATGQVWQTLGFLWSRVVRDKQLLGQGETAVSILSMVYYHPETIVHYQQEIDKVLPQYVAAMGEAAFAAAWEQGKGMAFETAVSLVRSALQSGK